MSTIITRLYETEATAKAVVKNLRGEGFSDADMEVLKPSGEDGFFAGALAAAGVPWSTAEAVGAKCAEGNAVVLVRPPFGTGAQATRIVDAAKVVDVGMPKAESIGGSEDMTTNIYPGKKYFLSDPDNPPLKDDPTPLSSAMGWRALKDPNPTQPLMARDKHIMPWKPLKDRNPTRPLMARDTTPLSSAIGWRLLSKPAETRPLLSKDRTPFSTMMGWKTLTE